MIQFILNNEEIRTSENVGMTLLDFIREKQQLKGTKIGCREGDCGACTVLVGSLVDNSVSYQSITSCISPLGNANGKHIVTIEGINLSEKLNSVQNAIADNYATQCGFCTPGFVVSMTGYSLQNDKNESTCIDAISGNICRCTGYKSIEKATKLISDKLIEASSVNKINWLIQHGFIPEYFLDIPQRLQEMVTEGSRSDKNSKKGKIVANGTDLYVQQADNLIEEHVNLIGLNTDLRFVKFENDQVSLGANSTVTDILDDERLNAVFPKLKDYLKLVSSEQIRNMGTLGGNFVNASPIGDMSVFFLALNSVLSIENSSGLIRTIPFKDFHHNYKQIDLKKDELVHSISFDIQENSIFNFEKVSKRTHLDIASVNSAISIELKNNLIFNVHISVGGVATIPKYLEKTRSFLIGKEINDQVILEAQDILQSEITPISDVRGSSSYKRLLARQLFYAHFIELFPTKISLQNLLTI